MLGRLEKVENKGKLAMASTTYWRVVVYAGDARQSECLLMTDNELHTLRQRARKNPEDCHVPKPPVPWLGWAMLTLAGVGIGALVWWT